MLRQAPPWNWHHRRFRDAPSSQQDFIRVGSRAAYAQRAHLAIMMERPRHVFQKGKWQISGSHFYFHADYQVAVSGHTYLL